MWFPTVNVEVPNPDATYVPGHVVSSETAFSLLEPTTPNCHVSKAVDGFDSITK